MTQDLQEKLRVMAEWDGWFMVFDSLYYVMKNDKRMWIEHMDYHTNISSLYPVAKKLMEDFESVIRDKEGEVQLYTPQIFEIAKAEEAIRKANNRFDIPALFAATHEGIVLLNKLNTR